MKTKIFTPILVSLLAISIVSAASLIPASDKAKEKAKAPKAPVIEKVDDHWILKPSGLEGIVFVHYARPDNPGKPNKQGNREKKPKCYEFLGKGIKWKELPVQYVIDPNHSGLAEGFVTDAMSLGAEEWDAWTSAELFRDTYGVVSDGSWDIDKPDGRNELVFADYQENGVIAVTVTWGYFSGPPSTRRIIEFDILFDTDWSWGYAGDTNEVGLGDPNIMDLRNIAAHELGHGVGLADVYEGTCSEVTMYGYSEEGETKKRTLDLPDAEGIAEPYGGIE
ncbi:MAG: matrixin family metalloprotease [Planctomycetota bacterium]|jgi:hypothetical protein